MRLKDILLGVRTQIEDGSYRAGLCVIVVLLRSKQQRKQYRDLLNSVLPTGNLGSPIPSGNPNITNIQAYTTYTTNTPLEGFDQEAYKAKRLELLDKVIVLCD